jgi:hypothetical protein
MVMSKKTGEQIGSLATIATSPKASFTSSAATWNDALDVVDKHFTAIARTMIDISRSHARRPNQALQPTPGRLVPLRLVNSTTKLVAKLGLGRRG